jgi:hypothetical protein
MAVGNIMGGPFFEWVTNQIEVRQQSLGRGSGNQTKDLLYQQSKTPWLRLASSVDFYSDESGGIDILKRLGGIDGINLNEITGPGAAKNFVLQGGAIALEGKNSFRQNSGLNLSPTTFRGAYGWGGVSERGLIPMPGITGASVKFMNDGALTKTEINIKCYSKNQLALVDALYMRPGYTLLLEFGWSTYLDNKGILQNYDNFYSPALSYLFDPNVTISNQHVLVNLIKQERETRVGNYEGVYGKITNFKWSFNADGSYDCIIYLTGLGEVIESLNTNISTETNEGLGASNKEKEEDEDEDGNEIPLIANATKSTMNEILFAIYQDAIKPPPPPPPPPPKSTARKLFDLFTPFDEIAAGLEIAGKALVNTYKKLTNGDQEYLVKSYTIQDFPYISPTGELKPQEIIIPKGVAVINGVDTDDSDNESPQVYITFGLLIALCQKNLIISTADNNCPYFYFDMNFLNLEEDKNFIKRIPGQFSGNPLCCFIPYTNHNISKTSFSPGAQKIWNLELENIPSFFDGKDMNGYMTQNGAKWEAETYLGRLSSIYVNANYLSKTIDLNPGDESNSKPLLQFVKTVIKDISKSLGGINEIIVRPNQDGTKMKFVENIPQKFDNAPEELSQGKMCRFNTFGFTDGTGGSIVRNIGIDAQISSNFSSMISIGAQSNGNQPGTNATSFSNYNNGLIDRVIPTKTYSDPVDPEPPKFAPEDTNRDGTVDKSEKIDAALAKLEAEEKEKAKILSQATNFNESIKKLLTSGFWEWDGGGVFADVYRDLQWIQQDTDLMTNLHSQYIKLIDGLNSQPKGAGGSGQTPAPFFLPFNLNLEIDGIGGIGLMQKFKIDEKVLPPAYDKDSVEIIVRGVDHEINESAWLTKIDTQSTPAADLQPSNSPLPSPDSQGTGPTTKTNPVTPDLPPPPGEQPPDEELLRIRVTRIMDDGEQTLGVMDILAEDEQTVLFSLATSELPWLGNENNISCIPVDNFRVKSHVSGKYGRCFWLIGNEKGKYAFNKLYDNGYTRGAVLIHMAPKAPKWLHGCIGPGLKFNQQTNQIGRQKGTGPFYLEPAKAQSQQAMNKILTELFSVGSFKMEIINNGGAENYTSPDALTGSWSDLPSSFTNQQVQSIAISKKLLPNPYKA